jgi:hypothetical protein
MPVDPETKALKAHCYVDMVDPIAFENALAKDGQVRSTRKALTLASANNYVL